MLNTVQSGFMKLSQNDFVKGFFVTIIAAIFTVIEQSLTTSVALDLHVVGQVALIAGLSYLSKNLLTTKDGKVMGAF